VGLVLRLLGTGLALCWVLGRVDLGVAAQAVRDAPAWVFLVAPAGVLTNTVIQATRVKRMLRAQAVELSLWRVLTALCRGAFVGLTLPSGGQELAKAAFLAKASPRTDAGIAALLSARVLQLPTWVLLLGGGLLSGLLLTDPLLGIAAAGFLGVSLVILGLCAWGLLRPAAPRLPLPSWTPAWVRVGLGQIVDALRSLRSSPGAMVQVGLLAVPCAAINITVVWALLIGFGASLTPGEVASLLPAADVLIWMPLSISGIGVREGLFVHFLAPRGLAAGAAVAVGLTRWTGELVRAMVGGILFILGDTVTEGPGIDGPRRERDA
jgi:uncharacterized membrane protein YbhN (UPF0104 family)